MVSVFFRQFPARRTYEGQGIAESAYLTYPWSTTGKEL